MDPSIAILIAIWIWIAAGVFLVIYAIVLALRNNNHEWWRIPITLGIALGGSGLLTLAITALGSSSVAQLVWRVTAVIAAVIALIISITTFVARQSLGGKPPGRLPAAVHLGRLGHIIWAAVAGIIVTSTMVWLSFQSSALAINSEAISAGALSRAPSTLTVVWVGALVLFAFGSIYFLFLFVQRLERGGAPQIETHWGGIGGGLGGWRMSTSLGYLLVAIVLMLLFGLFFFHFGPTGPTDQAPHNAAVTPTATPSPTPKDR